VADTQPGKLSGINAMQSIVVLCLQALFKNLIKRPQLT
jgi:hypothetical protein